MGESAHKDTGLPAAVSTARTIIEATEEFEPSAGAGAEALLLAVASEDVAERGVMKWALGRRRRARRRGTARRE